MRFWAIVVLTCSALMADADLRSCAHQAVDALGADPEAQVVFHFVDIAPGYDKDWLETFRAGGKRVRAKASDLIDVTLSRGAAGGVCTLQIQRGEERQTIVADFSQNEPNTEPASALTIERQLIWQEPGRLLDMRLDSAEHGFVLSTERLVEIGRAEGRWSVVRSFAIDGARQNSRDPRGRIIGAPVTAFVSGLRCTLPSAGSETLRCATASMPGAFEPALNLGQFVSGRNYFEDGALSFYSAASIAYGTVPLLAAVRLNGELDLLSADRRAPAGVVKDWGDEAVSLTPDCGLPLLISGTRDAGRLQAFRLRHFHVEPASPPVSLSGELTALWQMSSKEAAAITYDPSTRRSAAYLVTLACR